LMTWLLKISDVRKYVNSISDFSVGVWFDICLRFVSPVILAIIVATKLQALFTEGYGGYDLTLGWAIIAALLVIGILINASSRKEAY
ncbi:sodium-dependent transporter, partial [Vibrio cholerae]